MPNVITLQLAYPDPVLSPNSPKRHWRHKVAAKQFAKDYGRLEAFSWRDVFTTRDRLQMHLTFYPPNNARRDLDNAYSSMKAAIDGMCEGLEIDDSQIRRVVLEWGDAFKGGCVKIELKKYTKRS